jgi:allantoinase
MSDFDTVIQGRFVGEDGIVERGFAAVRDGKIAHLGSGQAPAARDVHDFGDAVVDGYKQREAELRAAIDDIN